MIVKVGCSQQVMAPPNNHIFRGKIAVTLGAETASEASRSVAEREGRGPVNSALRLSWCPAPSIPPPSSFRKMLSSQDGADCCWFSLEAKLVRCSFRPRCIFWSHTMLPKYDSQSISESCDHYKKKAHANVAPCFESKFPNFFNFLAPVRGPPFCPLTC